MKRSGFIKRLFAGAIGLTSLPAIAEKLTKTDNPVKDVVPPLNAVAEEVQVTPIKVNRPISVIVENTSPNTIRDIDLFDSFEENKKTFFNSDGEMLIPGCKVYSNMPGVSYKQIIDHISICPFTVGMMYVSFKESNTNDNGIVVMSRDAHGNTVHIPMPFWCHVDPYRFDEKVVVLHNEFRIDSITKIRLERLKAGDKATIQIYPMGEINQARRFRSFEIDQEYLSPNEKELLSKIPRTITDGRR